MDRLEWELVRRIIKMLIVRGRSLEKFVDDIKRIWKDELSRVD